MNSVVDNPYQSIYILFQFQQTLIKFFLTDLTHPTNNFQLPILIFITQSLILIPNKNTKLQITITITNLMHRSLKTSPKNILQEIKKRRETINLNEYQYELPQKIKSPKTDKKLTHSVKDIKTQLKQTKEKKVLYPEGKKSSRVISLTQNETDVTPKRSLFYHIDSSEFKQRPLRKIHSISLVDTPKKLNLKRRKQELLFTVQEEKDKQQGRKIASSCKIVSKSHSRPLKLEYNRLQGSTQRQDMPNASSTRSPVLNSAKSPKIYTPHNQNYNTYYNQNVNGSSSQLLKSSKKIKIPQNSTQNSSACHDKQKSSKTLRITRNSGTTCRGITENLKKSVQISSNIKRNKSKNYKSTTKHPKTNQFSLHNTDYNSSSLNESKFKEMFLKCSVVLKKYNTEMQLLKGENQTLKKENQFLKGYGTAL